MKERDFASEKYKYGFQKQEKDDELKGGGNSLNFKFRVDDPRLGRFFSVDPLSPKYPHNSPYSFSENKVIQAIELEGLEAFFVHGMGGNPEQWNDKDFSDQASMLKDYTNNTHFDKTFRWDVGRKVSENGEHHGRKLNGPLQTKKDREIAADMLVDHVLKYREANGIEDEEITLIGFSAGGLVSLRAAKKLAAMGYKVNIITYNTPAMPASNKEEHPAGNDGINDMLIINTEGDQLTNKLPGHAKRKYKKGTVPEKYQQVTIKSNAKLGILKHFVKNGNHESLKNAKIDKLDPVKEGKAQNKPD